MSKLTDVVATTLAYQLRDLDENRAGKLAMTQHQRLEQIRQRAMVQGGIVVAVFIALSLVPVVTGTASIPALIFSGGVGLVGVWIASRIVRVVMQIQRDVTDGIVEQATGVITLTRQSSTTTTSQRLRGGHRTKRNVRYGLEVDGELFHVTRATYEAFWDGKVYTIFYVPHSREIVAAEALEQ